MITWSYSHVGAVSLGNGIVLLPGALLDAPGSNNKIWLAAGIVHSVIVSCDDPDRIKLLVYDYVHNTTGQPLSIGTGSSKRVFQIDGGGSESAMFGGDSEVVIDGEGTGVSLTSPLSTARVVTTAVVNETSGGTTAVRRPFQLDINANCPFGMALFVQAVTATTNDIDITITYDATSTGGYRKARHDRGNVQSVIPG